MDISTITSFLKLPKKVIFLIAVITTVVLFSDQEFLEKLALYGFKEEFKVWIGVCFLFSSGLSILNLIELVSESVKNNKKEKKAALEAKKKQEDEALKKSNAEIREKEELETKEKVYLKKLERLDKYEMSNVREFYLQEQNTIKMSIEDPVVIGLVKKGIIRQVGDKGYHTSLTGLITFFCIDQRACDYFESYDFNIINNNERPKWLNGLKHQNALDAKIENLGNQMLRL